MRVVLFSLLCLTGAASAQEQVFEISEVEICLAGHVVDKRSCIGKAAAHCSQNSLGGETSFGMGGCLEKELIYWDAALNSAYLALIEQVRQIDADAEKNEWRVAKQVPALRKAQRAWIAYRDATCEYEYATWSGGTGGGPALLSCLMTLTGEQALRLQARLEER